MALSGALAAEWATRACRRHASAVLAAQGYHDAAQSLAALPSLVDTGACRAMSELARSHKEKVPISDEVRAQVLRAPWDADGALRAWVSLHLVEAMGDALATYVFEEPLADDEDASVVRAWIADTARTLALLAGGPEGADEEDAEQRREQVASSDVTPG